MDFRLAKESDLLEIKTMYKKLINRMNKDGIDIWDDIYPCEFFVNDILNGNLYIALKNEVIVGAFALVNAHIGEEAVEWKDSGAKALYIDRLGVNIEFAKQGIGSELLTAASKIATKRAVKYLRLFVINYNHPAITLYEKCGFTKVNGVYKEVIDKNLVFEEFGYEMKL